MNEQLIQEVSKDLKLPITKVAVVLDLLSEGATIPFIARYRKEMTGGMDEEQIFAINQAFEYAQNLLKRKEDVIRLIDEKGMLTEELKNEILNAKKLVEVEDLYRPFKEKKKTKATEAVAKGLQPLADFLLSFPKEDPIEEAKKYLKEDVKTVDEALEGAKYIVAEMISDNATYRKALRDYLFNQGVITSSVKKDGKTLDEKAVYEVYYDFSQPISKVKPHQILALNRAEDEKVVTVKLEGTKDGMEQYLIREVINKPSKADQYLNEAIADALKRLIFPSIEREIRSELSDKAENQAIEVFADNLQKLLLQPPLKGKVVLGVDPAFRTGCKLCIVDKNGMVLEKGVIYPHEKSVGAKVDETLLFESRLKLKVLYKKYQFEIVAIGNGTASRETESFISKVIKEESMNAKYVIVSEAGASVYSASEVAREEFPDYSVEERSAASIARRLQDPLAELVKIDPKSIGVGQYQHDVTPKKLDDTLNFVVTQVVNNVGVNANTASKSLLMYVSGLNKTAADNFVQYRNKIGGFRNRKDILKVPKLGPKAYEQAIGFLRIPDGDEILDMTSIHPESYELAKEVMKKLKIDPQEIGKASMRIWVDNLDRVSLAKELNTDKYTLDLILDAFVAPLRDPRDEFQQPILKSDILHIEDLQVGMELEGVVRNVTDFGAFVDIGLKNDGLVHISKISKQFIKHPKDVLSVGQIVKVWVLNIDLQKQKVGLTMINTAN
ncbi:RNA-binding transcriptional accessory protein [Acholeplasma equirhinis]|uniref:Tex-like N-terminal domain-containing protein n=1 Tax=Acholeplasma equirhinis TaxID=555393 RepID=UPI00197AE7D5|nr:Tex family protein [Acholeplasma equirhinis]MBN3490970.1 RNA-binding transcriptional accessory protein [Acholeplasma equirhinis]